jgi:type I restriction enzyme M protein
MDYKDLLIALGFSPKENAAGIYSKKYRQADGDYYVEVNFDKETIDYGHLIISDSKTTQNFFQPENFVVLECVNRLLEKGYKPENIVLEKTWAAGHGASGRLDICITRSDGSEYLLIECKTYGKEFDKAFVRMKRDGGQLFTYFKFSNKPDVVMLYASELQKNKIAYRNEIVKIEAGYRVGDVKDFYEKWNKLTKDNGIFDAWVKPYNFESKALTPKQLKPITQEDSGFIFSSFLEILRHNVVSDKPNAFNKIFTLFLCKVYDEKTTKPNEELKFQWLEGKDDDVSFQIRLTNLYKDGMRDFLEKEVTDFSEVDFDREYKHLDEKIKRSLMHRINKLRLEKNNEFAIKEVYDEKSFEENAKIVKEVVTLLQNFRLRYNKRQQYLSDFFELLLTTGLKQESGQFFTPVPVAQFIIKSLPVDALVDKKLEKGETNNLLPFLIDYAAGSGHFLTESMHEIQRLLDEKSSENYVESTAKKIKSWHADHFDWATQYIYGIEKDYRLVKVGKVGCYLHGDGLANVILSDGLASFENTKEYKDLLKRVDKDFPKENKQFDILVSNPPYSVSAFKNAAREYYTEKDFDLYDSLTDSSSEIECLFVERMKQLLKDGGVAGLILPSSILSNDGIYAKAREIILLYFQIVAIADLGSNTFMATGTNTVALFLRRRSNYDSLNLRSSIERFFDDFQDVTRNGIETPAAKYVNHVWENISLSDYVAMLKKEPNESIKQQEIYGEYRKKIKAKTEKDFWNTLIEIEKEKLFYFILAYPQNVVVVKTGDKDAEKQFLGYEFSNRRGSEGIHPIQRGKSIAECTRLFDENSFTNPEKASTYIYKAFAGDYDFPVHEALKSNISRVRLVDMLTFNRESFIKSISTAAKKKVKIDSQYEQVLLPNALQKIEGSTKKIEKFNIKESGKYPVITQEKENLISGYSDSKNPITDLPVLLFGDHSCSLKYVDFEFFRGADGTVLLKPNNDFIPKYFYDVLKYSVLDLIENKEKYERHYKYLQSLYIPQPPLEVQQKIVAEIDALEKKEAEVKDDMEAKKKQIFSLLGKFPQGNISDLCHVSNEKCNPQDFPDKEFLYLGLEHIESNAGTYIANFEKGKTILSTKNVFHKDDVLYGKLRPYLNKVAIAKEDGVSSTDILALKTNVPTILKYALLSGKLVEQTANLMKGISLPRIGVADFLNQKIPIPPLSGQQKIVAEIEKIEAQLSEAQKTIAAIPMQKSEVLRIYL